MAGRGQPNKYFSHVEPNLDKIREMSSFMTEKEIAKTLGVSYSAFNSYKLKYKELNDALKKGRTELVIDLKNTLVRKAMGYQYVEKKVIKEHGEVIREETCVKEVQPDVAAINLLLKNYDREFWRNDPADYELKKRALDIQEKKMDEGEWVDVPRIS